MNCRRVMNLLSAYVDGELTGVEMLEIRRHLSDCPDCAQEHAAVLLTKRAVSRLANVIPREEFVASLMSSLGEVQVPAYQKWINTFARATHKRFSPVAAALAVSGFAMVVLSAGGMVDSLNTSADQYAANAAYAAGATRVSFLPELRSSPESIASASPLMVASDATSVTNARFQFVSLDQPR